VGPESFIRLFNGTGTAANPTTSTFIVTLVGIPSGTIYGTPLSVAVPRLAAIQLSIAELYNLTGAGPPTGSDTSFAVYLQNPDSEAGYQHVVYDFTSTLFENMSICSAALNEQMIPLHNEIVVTNVHTSKVASNEFPSTIRIHNYSPVPTTYTLTVYNAGGRTNASGLVLQSDSGKLTCTLTGNTVAANSTLSIPFSTIESTPGCTLDSDESYADVVVAESSGTKAPNASVSHLIAAGTFQGNNLNMTPVCAVNPAAGGSSTNATGVYCGTSYSPPDIDNPSAGPSSGVFIVSVSPGGVLNGTDADTGTKIGKGGAFTGLVTGTTFTATTAEDQTTITGTIGNGTISGSYQPNGPGNGTGTLTGSTSSCASSSGY
jgi:hypothetical protein